MALGGLGGHGLIVPSQCPGKFSAYRASQDPSDLNPTGYMLTPMIGENRQLVTDEPVDVQDCRKITNHRIGIYIIYPNIIK